MVGTPERKDTSEFLNPKIKQIMETYTVDEETATKLSITVTVLAQEQMKKWCSNTLKIRREKAEDIYQLLKQLKKNEDWLDPILAEIEKKILELCINTDFGE